MPHYDYQCRSCGKRFEFFQSISSEPLTHCPDSVCEQPAKGAGKVERKISKGAGLIFNGSGFYQTDYVRSNDKTEKATSTSDKTEKATPAATEAITS
ncbi:zinc ribbon domain-containing protein [Ignavibacteria bacterium]